MKRLITVVLLLLGASLRATEIVPIVFKDVVRESSLIVVGRVTDVRAIVRTDGLGLDSAVTVAVDSAIKGQADRYITIRVPGGQLGRVRMTMVGAPRLLVGEAAVLFLKRGPENALWPVGLSAGVYLIQVDPRTGAGLVDPPLVAGYNAAVGSVTRGDPRRRLMALKDFTALVQVVAAGQALAPKVVR